MSRDLMLDVSQAHELKLAARRAGATNADLKRLSEGDAFALILPVLRGDGKVVIINHTIDCDSSPFIPDRWSVKQHQKGGQLRWNPDEVSLYLCDEQKGGSIEGNKLRKKLKDQPVLNACVLDYLLAHPQLIPDEWKGKFIYFWGTVYRDYLGSLVVRCLGWDDKQLDWDYDWLYDDFRDVDPAAILIK